MMTHSKYPRKTNLKKWYKEKKERYYEFNNSGDTNSDPIATNNNTKTGEAHRKYQDGTAGIIEYSIVNSATQESLSRIRNALYNFQRA